MKPRKGNRLKLRILAGRFSLLWRRRPFDKGERNRDEKVFLKVEEAVSAGKLFTRKSLSVDLLAGELNTNRTYVSNALRRNGFTFSSYINGYRIQYAILLLSDETQTDLSAEAIADRCGFMSVRTLNYYIRKTFGISFSTLRKRILAMAK